jgi:hypothetical protein
LREIDLVSEHCTTVQPEIELFKYFAQIFQLLVANHTVLVLLMIFQFYVPTLADSIPSGKSIIFCNHGMQP